MIKPLVTINVVVFNGEKYIRHCLNTVKAQTYENLEVNVFDNNSSDRTREVVQQEFPKFKLIAYHKNLGMWAGQEEALSYTQGKYVVALSVDVMLHRNFIEKAVTVSEADNRIGALQAKVYSYDYGQLADGSYQSSRTIDTCGFRLERSRRFTNIGHGQPDGEQFIHSREVFAVEGAVPFFRREALDDVRICNEIIDHDYFWYGDDLDLTWRMRLFGWKQWFEPAVIAYHDRSTTKGDRAHMKFSDWVRQWRAIPLQKRILDWANVRFTIVKNEYIINILKDLPQIMLREVQLLAFMLLFKPASLAAIPRFLRLLPTMLHKRTLVMARAKVPPNEIRKWIQ